MDARLILSILFRIGLMILAFYLGTKQFLYSHNFENFSMFAVHSKCKDTYPDCKHCGYYSIRYKKCGLQSGLPKDWEFMNPFLRVRRTDNLPTKEEFKRFIEEQVREHHKEQ